MEHSSQVSLPNREAAWKVLCDADYMSRYWSDAHQRLLRNGWWIAAVQAGLAAGAFGAVVAAFPHWAVPIAQAVLAAAAVFLLIRHPAWNLAATKMVRDRCNRIESKARRLWARIEGGTISDANAEDRWNDLRSDLDDATEKVEIGFRDAAAMRAAKQSNRNLKQEFQQG